MRRIFITYNEIISRERSYLGLVKVVVAIIKDEKTLRTYKVCHGFLFDHFFH